MSTAVLIPVREYLTTIYHPDCDYIDGELKERNVGERPHSLLQLIFGTIFLNNFDTWQAVAMTEQRVQINSSRYRIPDVCVVRATDPNDPIVSVAPLLCIEVLSSEDRFSRLQERIDDFASIGVENLWVLDPVERIGYYASTRGFVKTQDGMLRIAESDIVISLAEVFAQMDKATATRGRERTLSIYPYSVSDQIPNLIKVQLPDGSIREVPAGTTPFDIANNISPRLAAAVVVARVRPIGTTDTQTPDTEAAASQSEEAMYASAGGERLVDLSAPLYEDVSLELLKENDPAALRVARHSAAHIMATAILELFPETKLGHGPATDQGFFYDVYRETPFTEADLALIEARMQEVVARDEPFVRVEETREQGLDDYARAGEFMKVHFIERFTKPGDEISLYKNGAFTDFCRGPHVPSTARVKAFKLTSLAGAYWLGNENNQQLQRLYGTAFFSAKELDAHFKHLEEIKARDHRVLGKQLDLFSIQEIAGAGLIFWHPKGGLIRKIMEDWMRDECVRRGYSLVYTPHIMRRELWRISGHEAVYAENMYPPMELDDAEYRLKPMNCPGHILIYKSSPKSYRDLPQRYAELGNVYRYERSGTMHGLLRVRGFTQDDAHIFCTRAQITQEIEGCLDFAEAVLNTFGFAEYRVELSTHAPGNPDFIGTPAEWAQAEGALHDVLTKRGLTFQTFPGEAAFYGPKIDVKLVDVLGRLWQLSTVQFDFKLPQRFELEYTGEDGEKHQPVMVHRALFGSVERFFGVLIEHYAGAFPLWLAPVQVGLVPISNEKHLVYAEHVKQQLEAAGLRVELDASSNHMKARIRDFGLQKLPFILILGDKEAATEQVSVRVRAKGDSGSVPLADFIAKAKELTASHSMEL